MSKLICIIGVLDVVGSTNIPMALSFAKQGYAVIPVNYRTIIGRFGMSFFESHLLHICKTMKPELMLFSKCNGINSSIVEECGKYTKTWLFNMDPKKTIERCMEVINHAKVSHFSSCTGVDIVEWFESFGVKNCYHIIQGTDPDVFKPVTPVEELHADISLIGSRNAERDRYKDFLTKLGYDVKFYGPGYSNEMVNSDFAKVCSSSKFMLSIDSESSQHKEYFSNRLVRYLSCGVCVLHLDPLHTLDKYFQHGKEILYFDNEEMLHSLLQGTNEVGKIALSGRDRVLNTLTWDHTIKQILDRCGVSNKDVKEIL